MESSYTIDYENGVVGVASIGMVSIGIEPIEELDISPFSDIMSSSYGNTVKINELIRTVNKLVELENSKLRTGI